MGNGILLPDSVHPGGKNLLSTRVSSVARAFVAVLALLVPSAAHAQVLSINDVTQAETDAGTTTFTFTVSLDTPAGPGGVTFDIATAPNTATAGSDYVHQSLTGQSIAAGNNTYQFNVTVNGETVVEPNETFFVNVTSVTGATVGDGQGVGTINNDDITITPIHDIQGPGASSPIVLSSVTTRGIVTAVTANGFYIQEDDATVDADPATSEGIFVFTSSAPPVAAAVSARVQVTGTVTEFVPASDPLDPPSTRLTGPSVTQLQGPGQPLPTAVTLTTTFPDPAGPQDQLERVEGMRVSIVSLTVVGPSSGVVNESAATATSDGRFHGVLTGNARPFREPGIPAPDGPPSGSIPPIPRWDKNPERIRIESNALGQPAINVRSGDVVGPLAGVIDYSTRAYALLVDGTSTPIVTPGSALTTTVSTPLGNEVTVASVNLRLFFDTVDDAHADAVLTPTAFTRRLAKASIAIRTHLGNPDIIGVQEVENIAALNALAARILSDGGPDYDAFLEEGNDSNSLDVGFLVKTNLVTGGVARVSGVTVTQVGAADTWIDPVDNNPHILHDRPPLVLEATVNRTSTVGFPIVVIVTDMAGLDNINVENPSGLTTIGDRIRKRRQAQAQSLANLVQARQTTDPAEQLVVIGGFNAIDGNDGHVDVMNVVAGTPPPDNQTVVPGDGVDLVSPDLLNLASTPAAAQRYSEVFEGNARNVDHALVSAGLVAATIARRIEHPRIAADYPDTHVGDGTTALRFSDRDPVVAFFSTSALSLADLQITNVAAPNPAVAGQNLAYTITVTNAGPDAATSVSLADTLTVGTTFVSLVSPGGWSCTTPAVGAGGSISCSIASMSAGSAVFTLTVAVSPAATGALSNTASVGTSTNEPTTSNNVGVAVTPVDGAPTITNITDQTIVEDTVTAALSFTIGDVGTAPASLALSASSSNQTIVPNANIVLGGSGAARTVMVTPAANQSGGPVIITVTVSDSGFSSSDTFTVTVTPVNDAPTIAPIVNQTVAINTATGPLPVAIDDVDHVASGLTLSGASSNQALVPDAAIVFGGSGASRTVTVTPLLDQHGQATITVTVGDGVTTTSTSFVLTVTGPVPRTYFLAEGATGDFFDEDLLIANPSNTDAPVTVTFYREGLPSLSETRTVPARSGARLRVDALPGLESAAASVQISSDLGLPLAVERTQFWGVGSYGGHTESALTGPATRWYFAEGAQGYFETFVLVANPQSTPVDLTLTFLREQEAVVTTTVQVAPFSRTTIPAATISELANRAFGVIVDATQPVVAERAMYFGTTTTRPWSGGGAAAGVTAPSATWYFAEGATGGFFDTFILLMNPDVADAHVTLRYLLPGGENIDVPKVVPARGRLTVNIETESDPRLHAASISTLITSDRPIVAERSIYWPTSEGAQPWGESHASQGAAAAAPRWALAEGRTGGALNFHTYILLGNPGSQQAEVNVQFLPESGAAVVKTYIVPAMSRFTIDVTGEAPTIQDQSFITLVSTTGDVPIVVERSLYWDGAGITWSGGSNAPATRLP
jgi:uncharacterized protein